MRGLRRLAALGLLAALLLPVGCSYLNAPAPPRLVMFVGVDVSGSFLKGKDFDDSMAFLARYLYVHLKGLGGAEIPAALFVGSIGGDKANEPKVFFPIETFLNKSPEEIEAKLKEIFDQKKVDAHTDFNAFIEKISEMVKDRRMVLKPISIVLVSDGVLDMPGKKGKDFKLIDLSSVEKLSRNVTLRLLYTDASVGKQWESVVPRKRVKVWTQEAPVMETWKDPKIFLPDKPIDQQEMFFKWIKDNVDFNVRMKRVS